jgi:hypothetical protein
MDSRFVCVFFWRVVCVVRRKIAREILDGWTDGYAFCVQTDRQTDRNVFQKSFNDWIIYIYIYIMYICIYIRMWKN